MMACAAATPSVHCRTKATRAHRSFRIQSRATLASGSETVSVPSTCRAAAAEARGVLRLLREADIDDFPSRRVRVELPLPLVDVDSDDVAFLGLHGQAADWSGGMRQRFRATRQYVEEEMLDGYEAEFCGLLGSTEDGIGVWKCSNMTVLTHVSDSTFHPLYSLLQGEFGSSVLDPGHLIVVVNSFYTEGGGGVGQPWEFKLKAAAREILGKQGDWDKVYCMRAVRSAAGVEGKLWRTWPGQWMLLGEDGRVLLRQEDEPNLQQIAGALNDSQME